MLKPIFDNIPDELKLYPQWVNWRSVHRKEGGKATKPPYMPSCRLAETNDQATWSPFSAVADAAPRFDGVGYVLSKDDPYVGLDFDDCRCPAFDLVLPDVVNHINKLNSYTEGSPSGKGIRVFLKGTLPVDGKKKGNFEAYQARHYLTMTGHVLDGFPRTIEPRQIEVDEFYKAIFGAPEKPPDPEQPRQEQPSIDWKDRIEKAFQSVNGSKIKTLWNGDSSAYNSPSEADMALCAHLAFWLDRDPVAIDGIFRQSGLYRDKWDEKHGGYTYGEGTIQKAISGCQSFYSDQAQEESPQAVVSVTIPDPIPFDDYSNLPEFPIDALPDNVGKEMIIEVSKVNQIDPAFTAACYLAALSTCAQCKFIVDLISHTEHLNLYLAGVLPSGERKSPTIGVMTEPLYQYEKNQQAKSMPEILKLQNQRKILEGRICKVQKEAIKATETSEIDRHLKEADSLSEELVELNEIKLPRYIADDITTEKLGVLMADNEEKMSIISAEGGIFDILAGRYTGDGVGNIDLYLKAYSHDAFSDDRIGRASVSMRSPSLTLCLSAQPAVIEAIGKHKRFRGKGLLARFLYVFGKPRAGYRDRQKSAIPVLKRQYYNSFIDELMATPFGEELAIRFTQEGAGIWDEFYNDIEEQLRPGGQLYYLKDWGSKLPGNVARIAGLLHFAHYKGDSANHLISADFAEASCAIGAYFIDHAIAVFGLMNEREDVKAAKTILDYVTREKPKTFKARELFNHTNLKSMEEIEPGLKLLCERIYIRPMDKGSNGLRRGRPEAEVYEVNPKYYNFIS